MTRRFTLRRRARRDQGSAPDELVCREVVELVTAYLDDALEPAQRAALERHLAVCPHCTEYFAQIKLVRAAAGRVTSTDIAPQAKQDLMALYERWRADPDSAAVGDADRGEDEDGDARGDAG